MTRLKTVRLIEIVLLCIYISLFILDSILTFWGDRSIVILSIVLAFMSLNMMTKGIIIKSGSTIWFSLNLIMIAIVLIVFNLTRINLMDYYLVLVLIPIVASLINLIVFKNFIYIKVIIINISVFIPILINYLLNLQVLWFVVISILSILFGVFFCRSLDLDKERKNG